MAKDSKKPAETQPAENAAHVTHLPLEYGDWKTDAHALGYPHGAPIPKALAYVIANGFKQSMTDASAMTKEQKEKAHKEAQATHGPDITLEQAVEAHAHAQRSKRFADILAGTVGFGGGGPKLPQVDRVMREIAEEQIKAAVVAKGLSMPKGDNLKALIEKRLAVAGDAIRTAAQARIDAARNAVADLGIDLS